MCDVVGGEWLSLEGEVEPKLVLMVVNFLFCRVGVDKEPDLVLLSVGGVT